MPDITQLPLEEVLALPIYPTADIFPMLLDEGKAPDGYEGMTIHQLSDELAAVGVRVPLIIWNGFLLDGRNRREAARIANKINEGILKTLPVRYETFETEEEADSWVLSLNIDHRTLNKDQLACLAVRYWDVEEKRSQERMKAGVSDPSSKLMKGTGTAGALATRFHVSNSYVTAARGLFLNDLPKFNLAASGRKKVIGSLVSPGQNITPDTDPVERALNDINNGFNKVNSGLTGLLDSDPGEGQTKGLGNFETKLDRLNESWRLLKEKRGL